MALCTQLNIHLTDAVVIISNVEIEYLLNFIKLDLKDLDINITLKVCVMYDYLQQNYI